MARQSKGEWHSQQISAKHLKKIADKDFTFVSVYINDEDDPNYNVPRKFVLWLSKPKAEIQKRAEQFIQRVYGKHYEFSVYPRNYIRDVKDLAAIGLHEDASTEEIEKVFDAYNQHNERRRKLIAERKAALEARNRQEQQAGIHEEMESMRQLEQYTGTYIGDMGGMSVPMYKDVRGFVHIAPAWMAKYPVGQKFRNGEPVNSLRGGRKKRPRRSLRRKNPYATRKNPIVPVYLASHGRGEPRMVRVPDDTSDDDLLEATFRYGQNDFQPQTAPSVSVGDVIRLPDGSLHRVMFAGFKRLPDGYNPLTLTGDDAWKDGYNFRRRNPVRSLWRRNPECKQCGCDYDELNADGICSVCEDSCRDCDTQERVTNGQCVWCRAADQGYPYGECDDCMGANASDLSCACCPQGKCKKCKVGLNDRGRCPQCNKKPHRRNPECTCRSAIGQGLYAEQWAQQMCPIHKPGSTEKETPRCTCMDAVGYGPYAMQWAEYTCPAHGKNSEKRHLRRRNF